jgi:hypothetical protein
MGCEAQVHEKTDKHETWAYYSVNGWYLFTLSEHHHTHNCHFNHTKSKQLSVTVQFQNKCITNPSITHTDKVMHALADFVKVIQGMMGKAGNSQATQDLHHIFDATQAHLQGNPNKFEETITLDDTRNNQCVPRVQAPLSIPKPHTNGNRQIMCSMHPQSPVPRVPTNKPTGKPISISLVAITIKLNGKPACAPGIKPTTLPADLSKCKHLCKQQVAQVCNAATPTSPTLRIRI